MSQQDDTPLTPVEEFRLRARRNRWIIAAAVVLLSGIGIYTRFVLPIPTDYVSVEEHFKYGSIGSDVDNGIPYWLWKVMPGLCPDHLERRGDGSSPDYRAFGFIQEPGHDRPIGFSKRQTSGIELVGLNCSVCHTGTVRSAPEAPREVVLTMPAHNLDLLAYFEFLFDCAGDSRFTVDNVMAHVDATTKLGPAERLIYRSAVPRLREALLARAGRLAPLRTERFRSGKGRIDTFNPYKAMVLNYPEVERAAPGASDLPSIWNQGIRKEMRLHWDGNNNSLFERNISAAIGAGVTPTSVDLPRIERIAAWLQMVPPPKAMAEELHGGGFAAGKQLYGQHCNGCHGLPENKWQGGRVGKVEPLAAIGTDPSRWLSYTYAFAESQWTIGAGHDWRFRHFRKTDGYANMPLDGVWARAPYLHNGSVPTLRDLLNKPSHEDTPAQAARFGALVEGKSPQQVERAVREEIARSRAQGERPLAFYRGYDVLDHDNVGFRADVGFEQKRRYHLYNTAQEGCHNTGHEYGTSLSAQEKEQLLAFLKTL
ncbi:MAG: hypothetical protein QM778_28745 [Myxococcales bacterium]